LEGEAGPFGVLSDLVTQPEVDDEEQVMREIDGLVERIKSLLMRMPVERRRWTTLRVTQEISRAMQQEAVEGTG
jgi:hypothetical protein